MLRERASLSVASINGLRAIMSFSERFSHDPSRIPMNQDLIRAVKGSHKRHLQRLEKSAEPSTKKIRHDDSDRVKKDAEEKLQDEIRHAKKMLGNAELLFSKGMKTRCFSDIQSGQALLKEGQERLSTALAKLGSFQDRKSKR